MSEAYASIKACLGISNEHLVTTSAQFCRALKLAKSPVQTQDDHRRKTFGVSRAAKMIHKNDKKFFINRTLRWELDLITAALQASWIDMNRPIGHMVPSRDPRAPAWSDSSLHAAGGTASN